jgi:hypothetical protein
MDLSPGPVLARTRHPIETRRFGWVQLFRISFGLLTLAALLRQLTIHLQLGFGLANFFSYYTILGNLFAGCVLLVTAAPVRISARSLAILRVISVINMALVGIVFSALLRDADVGSLLPWVNLVHHYLMPCIVLIDWILVPPRSSLGRREVVFSLIFPLAYVVYVLVRGKIIGWYPYPFLNPSIAGGAVGVAMYVIGITLVFGIVGLALIALGNWRRKI